MTICYICDKCGYEFWSFEADQYIRYFKKKLEFRKIGKDLSETIYYCPKCDSREYTFKTTMHVHRDCGMGEWWWLNKIC